MAERKEIGVIEYISDHSCGNYQIGEIDSLPDAMVEIHIDRFGEYGFRELMRYFNRGIQQAMNKIQARRLADEGGDASAKVHVGG